jgi:hypothetical protein
MINPDTITADYSTIPKNSYAAFDAISIRNLIIERLNDKQIFTDQNYIGSNISSIIDIVSYAFNTLLFYLNRTSTESMFSEAQLYENINRIVKLLDYKPIGYQTSTLSFQVSADNTMQAYGNFFTIPRYSYLVVGGVPFSFNEDISFSIPKGTTAPIELTTISNNKLLYQGVFKESPVVVSTGEANELVVLNSANSNIDHFNVHVYVYESKKQKWVQYYETQSLYTEPPYAAVFERRLNSDKLYEITFGDSITGRKLDAGDKIIIYSLQSSGTQGVIGPLILQNIKGGSVYDTATFNQIYPDIKQEQSSVVLNGVSFQKLKFNNTAGSTIPKEIESADSIRKNAPSNFKSQYRLVTQKDFETYIKINHDNFIADVKVLNNWEYMSLYLKYFNDIQVAPTSFQQIAFNQIQYADACNFNNVYVCAIPKVSLFSALKYLLPAQKENILSSITPVKMLTTEVTFLDPIFKAISIGMETANNSLDVNDTNFCKLELVKTPGSNRTNQSIIAEVATIFQTAFDSQQQTLGAVFDFSKLTALVLQVDGISQINTTRIDTNETVSGISFFVWNPTYPTLDRAVVKNNLVLKPFEFLYFNNLNSISERLIVTESATNNIKF